MDHGNTAPRSVGRPLSADAPPSPPRPFNMAKHRQWFGEVCGANGRKIGAMIRRMEA